MSLSLTNGKRCFLCLIGIFTTGTEVNHDYFNLQSYSRHIDNWLIIDNGLTDLEKKIISRILGRKRGKFIEDHTPIQNFSEFRNRSITLAQALYNPDFVIETDDSVGIQGLERSFLRESIDYYITPFEVIEKNSIGTCVKIFKPIPSYQGRVHEVLIPQSKRVARLNGVSFIDYKLDLKRTAKRDDERMMLLDLEDGLNVVSNNYQLAMLYERKGEFDKAFHYYERVTKNNDASKELKCNSYIRMAVLKKNTNHFFYAAQECPLRVEPWYWLWKVTGHKRFLAQAKKRKFPKDHHSEINLEMYRELGII